MVRSDLGRHVRVDGFLAVLDGGPGELWLVLGRHRPDPDAVEAR
jgi:hypothetical protein